MRRLKLMADYDCWPLWRVGGAVGNVDPKELPISQDLKERLVAWADRYDSTLNRRDPASSGFPGWESVDEFAEEGKRLREDLQNQLGDEWEVIYFDLRQFGMPLKLGEER